MTTENERALLSNRNSERNLALLPEEKTDCSGGQQTSSNSTTAEITIEMGGRRMAVDSRVEQGGKDGCGSNAIGEIRDDLAGGVIHCKCLPRQPTNKDWLRK